jgi:hypothetical protein
VSQAAAEETGHRNQSATEGKAGPASAEKQEMNDGCAD